MGIAGLWSSWKSSASEFVQSFTMLTINADDHALMRNYHKPNDEKRMVVVLPDDAYEGWLRADLNQAMNFMRQIPAERLAAAPQGIDGIP